MASDDNIPHFYFSQFNFDHDIPGNYINNVPISDHHQLEPINNAKAKHDNIFGMEDFGDQEANIDHNQYGLYDDQHNYKADNKGLMVSLLSQDQDQEQQQEHDQAKSNYSIFEDFDPNSVFSQSQFLPLPETSTTLDHLPCATRNPDVIGKKIQTQTPFASLELLSSHMRGVHKLRLSAEKRPIDGGEKGGYNPGRGGREVSTEEIVRIAGARYIEFSAQFGSNDIGGAAASSYVPVDHPFGYALSGLSEGETKDVELVHLLLAAAEKVGFQQFERAATLLRNCEILASAGANPVERVVAVFVHGLWDRIERETGRLQRRAVFPGGGEVVDEAMAQGLSSNLTTLNYHQQVPFLQVLQFPAVQAILEAFESSTASKLHLIDLEIRSGIQWTGLMQALAARSREGHRPVELLRLTALAADGREQKLEPTRKLLTSLAESLNLAFAFDSADGSTFAPEKGAVLAVHASMLLRTMLSSPGRLEKLMRALAKLRPLLMTVAEVEAELNSPSFSRRFIEALFFYAAFFDCFDTCLKGGRSGDGEFRGTMEAVLAVGIRNIVAAEGAERVNRSVRIGVWRAFFGRFGMVEARLSESCHYQARLVAEQFGHCAGSCTVRRDGESLVVGWKGTPIHSLSAWTFL